jgi:Mg2+ and Co2+ transporter CorA
MEALRTVLNNNPEIMDIISTLFAVVCYILYIIIQAKVTKSGTTLKTIVKEKVSGLETLVDSNVSKLQTVVNDSISKTSNDYLALSEKQKELEKRIFSNDKALQEITSLSKQNVEALQLLIAQNVVIAKAQKAAYEATVINPETINSLRGMLNLIIGNDKSASEMNTTLRKLEKASFVTENITSVIDENSDNGEEV